MWKLCVLREFELRSPDGREFVTRSSAARELICLLALSGPTGIARASLANHLFEERPNPTAALNVLISRLRSALEAHSDVPLLVTTGHRLHLAQVESDAFRLLAAIGHGTPTPATMEAALAALDGASPDLVPGAYRSSLVGALRDDLCVRILATFASWAQSPNIERWRPGLLRAVTLIQTHLPNNGITVERLLLIFGALGLKELLLKTYDDYESFLENEFGERTPRSVEGLVEDLIGALDAQHREANRFPHFDLPVVYGRETELRHLVSVAAMPGVHMVAGHSGIGKTTLLQAFAASATLAGLKRSWIDLAFEDEEKAFVTALSQGPDVLFIDHYTARHSGFVARLHHALGAARLFVAGVSPAKIPATTILMLGPLASHPDDLEGPANPGATPASPAVALFLDRVARYGGTVGRGGKGGADEAEIVALAEGVPYVVDMLARLTATAGPHVSKGLLARWRANASADGVEHVWPSLMIATRASVEALSPEARGALARLARLDAPVPTDLMLEAGGLSPEAFGELRASGLVRGDDAGGSIRIHGISGSAIEACTREGLSDEAFRAFVGDLARRLLREPETTLGGSETARGAAQILVNRLLPIDPDLGTRLLEEVRGFLVAGATIALEEPVLRAYAAREGMDDESWATTRLGYGAYLFAHARYEDMLAFLAEATTDARMLLLSEITRANLLSQRALALRCLGRFEEALTLYHAALDAARQGGAHQGGNGSGAGAAEEGEVAERIAPYDRTVADAGRDRRTIAKISYNLAMLYVQTGVEAETGLAHLDEAIRLLAHTPNQAAKVELLHMRAILMDAGGASLASVEDELRAALVHAAGFGLTMQVAWIAQNLGMVYARHGHPGRAVVCEASAVSLAVGQREGLGKESLRLLRSSLGTLGASLQELGHYGHGVTCRTLMDRVGVYETCKQSEELVESLQASTFRGSVTWEEFPVTADEIRERCARYLDQVLSDDPALARFLAEIDALSGGRLGGTYLTDGHLAALGAGR